jgi:hypothetical protein
VKTVVLVLVIACSSSSAPVPPPTPASDAAVAPLPPDPAPAAVGGSADPLPVECGLYKALAGKLAHCEQLGPQRALLENQFETSWKAWTALPRTERAGVAAGCRAAADALRVALAPCG